jgi:hypothetical protein
MTNHAQTVIKSAIARTSNAFKQKPNTRRAIGRAFCNESNFIV